MSSCNRFAPALTRYLIEGGELPPEALDHLRHCADCAATVRRAELLGELLEHPVDEVPAITEAPLPLPPLVSEAVAASVRRRRRLRTAVAVSILAIALATAWATAFMHTRHPNAIWMIQMILFAGPLVLAATTAGLDDAAPSRVYKRMRGRQLSGVCQGLAEAYRIPVWIVRTSFFALIFLKGAGVVLYLLLDVLLPIHPDDRETLLRFRIGRWWKRRFAPA